MYALGVRPLPRGRWWARRGAVAGGQSGRSRSSSWLELGDTSAAGTALVVRRPYAAHRLGETRAPRRRRARGPPPSPARRRVARSLASLTRSAGSDGGWRDRRRGTRTSASASRADRGGGPWCAGQVHRRGTCSRTCRAGGRSRREHVVGHGAQRLVERPGLEALVGLHLPLRAHAGDRLSHEVDELGVRQHLGDAGRHAVEQVGVGVARRRLPTAAQPAPATNWAAYQSRPRSRCPPPPPRRPEPWVSR